MLDDIVFINKSIYQSGDPTDYLWESTTGLTGFESSERYYTTSSGFRKSLGNPTEPGDGVTWTVISAGTAVPGTAIWLAERYTVSGITSGWSITSVAAYVNSDLLIDSSVTSAKIADNAITTAKLVDNAITTTEISDNAVTTAKVAANAITANEIAANAVTASEIAANTVTASEIAANTVTASQIAAGTITATQIATGTITSDQIATNSIVAGDINTSGLVADSVAAEDITGTVISAKTLATSKFRISNQNLFENNDEQTKYFPLALVGGLTVSSTAAANTYHTGSGVEFLGQDHFTGFNARGMNASDSGTALTFIVTAQGLVDDYISIYYSIYSSGSYGSWVHIAQVQEPQGDYGTAAVVGTVTQTMYPASKIRFAVRACDSNGNKYGGVNHNPNITGGLVVTASNM